MIINKLLYSQNLKHKMRRRTHILYFDTTKEMNIAISKPNQLATKKLTLFNATDFELLQKNPVNMVVASWFVTSHLSYGGH